MDKIIRNKVFSCNYYKEKCFGVDAESLIDLAVELKTIGGLYGRTRKPTEFMCLLVKLL